MFRVLTDRPRRRLTTPRFIAGSLAVHLVAALVVARASTAAPPELPETPPLIRYTDIEPARRTDPPPPPETRPMREGTTREIHPPTTVPDRIPDPDPEERPADPAEYTGLGVIGDTVVEHPRHQPPSQPPGSDPGRRPDWGDGLLPAELADVPPSLANGAEAARLLERNYPAIYAEARVAGRTVLEVVVEANGRVRPGSARVVETTHEHFGQAAVRIVERFRFNPARVGDEPVPVLVQVPIQWRPAH